MMSEWLFYLQQNLITSYVFVVLLGLCIGSFLNVIIYRYPRILEEEWRRECQLFLKLAAADTGTQKNQWRSVRSFCPHCQTKLKYWQLIPLLSFILQRSRCRYCQARISWIYPIVELLSAITTLWVFIKFGFSYETLAAWVFSWGLIAMSFIDLKEKILPDSMTLSLLWLGLLISLGSLFLSSQQAIMGAVTGYAILWFAAKLFHLVRRKEGMGHGDFKMLAMLGAWLGMISLLNAIIIAVIFGLLANIILLCCSKVTRHEPVPFGPSLAVAGWLTLMFGPFLSTALMLWIMT